MLPLTSISHNRLASSAMTTGIKIALSTGRAYSRALYALANSSGSVEVSRPVQRNTTTGTTRQIAKSWRRRAF